jgi:magnesium transporter
MLYCRRRYHPPGTVPGTLAKESENGSKPPARVSIFSYNKDDVREKKDASLDDYAAFKDGGKVTWIHVQGPPDANLLNQLGKTYGLHALALEDVSNAGQRTKIDAYNEQYFIAINHMVHDTEAEQLRNEQISLFLGADFVISIHDGETDIFDPVRTRLRTPGTRLRKSGADYLAYALLDVVVDSSFPLLDDMGERLESIEAGLLENPEPAILDTIHVIKRELITMRRNFWSQREMLNTAIRDEDEFIADSTTPYLRDCQDHAVQNLELTEAYREMASSMLDVYLSSVSNRTNEVMRVLTIISVIFMPLTFIVGVYGMNFSTEKSPWNMPELGWYYGYFYSLGVMAIIVIGMIVYFKRKKWL